MSSFFVVASSPQAELSPDAFLESEPETVSSTATMFLPAGIAIVVIAVLVGLVIFLKKRKEQN